MSVGNKLIQAAAGNVVGDQVDANFSDTTLLLQGDMTNVTMSYNAFGDASTNAHDITPVGGVHGTPFSPYNESWSVEFDGTGDYLQVASDSTLSLDGDFTIEWWMYRDSDVTEAFFTLGDSKLSTGIEVYVGNSGNNLYTYSNDAIQISSTTLPAISSWSHLALVRSGTTITMYLDGSSLGTWTSASATFSGNLYIGAEFYNSTLTGSTVFAGYLSNLRVVKGTAVYTSSFTPSTTPLTDVSGTSVLTCNANRFIDTSSNAHTITVNGDPEIKGFSPFTDTDTVTGSGYFDGSGDRLVLSPSEQFNFGSGDFTVEAWFYATSINAGGTHHIVSYATNTTNFWAIRFRNSDNSGLQFRLFQGSEIVNISQGSDFTTTDQWFHVAVTRNGNSWRMFLDGTQVGSTVTNSSAISDYTGSLQVGDIASIGETFTGYIANARLVKGTAIYTSNFTPPTSPLTAVSGTSLLTLQNRGANRNIGFIDSSHPTREITRNGNVTQGSFSPFSQDEGKWGNYFDGSGDWLVSPTDADFTFGTGDYTIELWVYKSNNDTANYSVWSTNWGAGGSLLCTFGHPSSGAGKIALFDHSVNAGAAFITSTNTFANATWHHVAISRSGTTCKLYVNGVEEASGTQSTNLSRDVFVVGAVYTTGTDPFLGYMSNVRVVKGTAVYTSAFTPPTEPLTDITNTSLLTCQSNRFVDNSSNAHAITVNGDPEVTPFSPFAPSTAYDPATKGGSGYFDGTGDYLDLAQDSEFNLSGDFTIEVWWYATSSSDPGYLFDFRVSGSTTLAYIYQNDKIDFYLNGTQYLTSLGETYPYYRWNHFAVTRSGSTLSIYYNGERVNTATNSSTGANSTVRIGARSNAVEVWNGYLSDFRIVNGSSVYDPTQTTITVPTAPLTKTDSTVLLCNFTNAGIYDGTGRNVLETIGDAHVENSVKKYGTGSMQFDGTGDYLVAPASEAWTFGAAEDFTIEFWFYPVGTVPTAGNVPAILVTNFEDWNTWQNRWAIALGEDKVKWYNASGTAVIISNSFSYSTWTHVAVVRSASSIKMYVNGVQEGSTQTTDQNYSQVQQLRIGFTTNAAAYDGYIDDLRVTKGVARYTANFTPPAAKLPNL